MDGTKRRKKLQDVNRQLRPWLNFATAIPFTETPPPPWYASAEAVQRVKNATSTLMRLLVENLEPVMAASSAKGLNATVPGVASEHYQLFWTVRTTLDWLAQADHSKREALPRRKRIMLAPVGTIAADLVCISHNGMVEFVSNAAWGRFKEALQDVEASRLHHCPIKTCRRIYYAWRKNKRACDEHLASARVLRSRNKRKSDPEKTKQYEKSRRTNRTVKQAIQAGKWTEAAVERVIAQARRKA
jgi:hypothetical protein